MLNNKYPTMNFIGNNILPTYLGNYGPSYASNNNIPNPWTMIPNPYYPRNLQLTFSKTLGPATYLFPNIVSTRIATTKGSQGVQVFVMTPLVTTPTSELFTENQMPYFQSPTQNSPLGIRNSRGGKPMKDNGSLFHGSGRPPRGGNEPSRGGGGPPSGGGPPGGGGGGFLVGGACVPFDVPWLGSPWNPWYPSWCPPLTPTTLVTPSSRKALPFPIYFAGTNPNAHIQMFQKAIQANGEKWDANIVTYFVSL